jgi:hypothetical protein
LKPFDVITAPSKKIGILPKILIDKGLSARLNAAFEAVIVMPILSPYAKHSTVWHIVCLLITGIHPVRVIKLDASSLCDLLSLITVHAKIFIVLKIVLKVDAAHGF